MMTKTPTTMLLMKSYLFWKCMKAPTCTSLQQVKEITKSLSVPYEIFRHTPPMAFRKTWIILTDKMETPRVAEYLIRVDPTLRCTCTQQLRWKSGVENPSKLQYTYAAFLVYSNPLSLEVCKETQRKRIHLFIAECTLTSEFPFQTMSMIIKSLLLICLCLLTYNHRWSIYLFHRFIDLYSAELFAVEYERMRRQQREIRRIYYLRMRNVSSAVLVGQMGMGTASSVGGSGSPKDLGSHSVHHPSLQQPDMVPPSFTPSHPIAGKGETRRIAEGKDEKNLSSSFFIFGIIFSDLHILSSSSKYHFSSFKWSISTVWKCVCVWKHGMEIWWWSISDNDECT